MTNEEIGREIERHQHWLNRDCEGWRTMRANFSGQDLTGADLSGRDLRGAVFDGADLTSANCTGSDLEGSQFRESVLRDTEFNHSNLADSEMQGSYMEGTVYQDACLHGADMSGSYIDADFTNADVSGLILDGTDIHGRGLDMADMSCGKPAPLDLEKELSSLRKHISDYRANPADPERFANAAYALNMAETRFHALGENTDALYQVKNGFIHSFEHELWRKTEGMNEKDMKEQGFSMPGVRGFSYEKGDRGTQYSKLCLDIAPFADDPGFRFAMLPPKMEQPALTYARLSQAYGEGERDGLYPVVSGKTSEEVAREMVLIEARNAVSHGAAGTDIPTPRSGLHGRLTGVGTNAEKELKSQRLYTRAVLQMYLTPEKFGLRESELNPAYLRETADILGPDGKERFLNIAVCNLEKELNQTPDAEKQHAVKTRLNEVRKEAAEAKLDLLRETYLPGQTIENVPAALITIRARDIRANRFTEQTPRIDDIHAAFQADRTRLASDMHMVLGQYKIANPDGSVRTPESVKDLADHRKEARAVAYISTENPFEDTVREAAALESRITDLDRHEDEFDGKDAKEEHKRSNDREIGA